LGSYNVFPGNVTSQSSDVIAVAVEAAVADGMDVLNLSLGGLAEVGPDALVDAVNAAADAGVIVAVAAGNSGPFAGSIQSPGIASGVITAGASTNPHFLGVPVAEQNSPMTTFGAAVGAGPSFGSPTTAVLALWPGDNRACSPVSGTPFTGKIVLIRRGVCTFSTKDANAAAAGAIGMIVTNSVAGDPISMGAAFPFVIPGVMVGISNRAALLNYISAQGNNAIVSVNGATPAEFFSDGAGADILAGFSSIGPPVLLNLIDPTKSRLVSLIKPDVTAPGVNVYSSVTSDQCSAPPCFAFFQGTSMATPHVAGAAAVLKQLHPNWSPSMIKSVLVTTAKRPVGSSGSNTPLDNPMSRGGGRINLAAAIQAGATVNTNNDQVDADFGLIVRAYAQRSIDVSVNSVITSTVTYTITVNEAISGACGCVSVSATSITVRPGDGPNFSLTISMNPSILAGDYFGDVVLSGGTVALTVPYWFEFNPVAGPTAGHSPQN
jgi:minor extracellular serine protease Vpr